MRLFVASLCIAPLVMACASPRPAPMPEQPPAEGAPPKSAAAAGGEDSAGELAKKTQNPVADLISIPFQSNWYWDVGPNDNTRYVLNMQPVYPVSLNDEWNLINRAIVPYIDDPVTGETAIGDIQYQGFFSPANSKGLIWGLGPVIQAPTATEDILGSEKWAAGPAFVALKMDGPWVYGALINNLWDFAGEDSRGDVNQLVLQPFVNYNLPGGAYLSYNPVITADWERDADDRWTVPIGLAVGKIIRPGLLPLNISLGAFRNVERPAGAPEWQARFSVTILLPKSR